jgi:recombination protein U
MIKYPNKKRIPNTIDKKQSASNRGMHLEKELDLTNEYYRVHELANIHKKPTPIQVVKVDYPHRQAAKIVEAYYKRPSTTDYNGIYQSYYIDFEAKETNNKSYFVFKNIHLHQIKHLTSIIKHGGIAFFIIKFNFYDEVYLIEAQEIIDDINKELKSISYQSIKERGYLLEQKYSPRIDYLSVVDQLIKKIKNGR